MTTSTHGGARRGNKATNKRQQQQKLKSGKPKSHRHYKLMATKTQHGGVGSIEKEPIFALVNVGMPELVVEELHDQLPFQKSKTNSQKVPPPRPTAAKPSELQRPIPPLPPRKSEELPLPPLPPLPHTTPPLPPLPNTRTAPPIPSKTSLSVNEIEKSPKLTDEQETILQNAFLSLSKQNPKKKSILAEQCKSKNRYNNIFSAEQSQVFIGMYEESKDKSCDNYINASYINLPKATPTLEYIATQGPLEQSSGKQNTINTITDFWQMIWEQNTKVICMLTNLVEKSKNKCAAYMNFEQTTPFSSGNYQISLRETKYSNDDLTDETKGDHTIEIRHVILLNTQTNESRALKHVWYKAWPDHGVPGKHQGILSVSKLVDEYKEVALPVIHCSAGVGRTGTLIAINYILNSYKTNTNGTLQKMLSETMSDMREQRTHMIQTHEQYIFVYYAVRNYLENEKNQQQGYNYEKFFEITELQTEPQTQPQTPPQTEFGTVLLTQQLPIKSPSKHNEGTKIKVEQPKTTNKIQGQNIVIKKGTEEEQMIIQSINNTLNNPINNTNLNQSGAKQLFVVRVDTESPEFYIVKVKNNKLIKKKLIESVCDEGMTETEKKTKIKKNSIYLYKKKKQASNEYVYRVIYYKEDGEITDNPFASRQKKLAIELPSKYYPDFNSINVLKCEENSKNRAPRFDQSTSYAGGARTLKRNNNKSASATKHTRKRRQTTMAAKQRKLLLKTTMKRV
jgi:protein tyrosine phosphatase